MVGFNEDERGTEGMSRASRPLVGIEAPPSARGKDRPTRWTACGQQLSFPDADWPTA
jgi:hypothetical protein